MEGAGEPMRVGGLVGMDGIVVRAVVVVSGARFCLLLLLRWESDVRSVSSRARFWLLPMLGDCLLLIRRLMRLNCECRMIETSGFFGNVRATI